MDAQDLKADGYLSKRGATVRKTNNLDDRTIFRAEGVIFDFDGTLGDSMWVWEDLDVTFLENRGQVYDDEFGEVMRSLPFRDAARYAKDRYGFTDSVEAITTEWFEMVQDRYRDDVRLKPGARDCLSWLREKKIPLVVCTASVPQLVVTALRSNGVEDWFEAIITEHDVMVPKSEPDMYWAGAERIDVPPERCVVFEDVLHGLEGAKKGGFNAVAVFDEISSTSKWEHMKAVADYAMPDAFERFENERIFLPGGWFVS